MTIYNKHTYVSNMLFKGCAKCTPPPLFILIASPQLITMVEHTLSGNKPIYMLGESFGGALALAVAARKQVQYSFFVFDLNTDFSNVLREVTIAPFSSFHEDSHDVRIQFT
ncbi:putative alpha/Beta hydrolase [Helianthus anomalus]